MVRRVYKRLNGRRGEGGVMSGHILQGFWGLLIVSLLYHLHGKEGLAWIYLGGVVITLALYILIATREAK